MVANSAHFRARTFFPLWPLAHLYPSSSPQPLLLKQNFKKAATAAANSNAKSVSKITLKKDVKTGLKNLAHIVGTGSKKVKGKEVSYTYRPDLLATASLRYKKLKKAADIRSGKGRKALPATTRNSRNA